MSGCRGEITLDLRHIERLFTCPNKSTTRPPDEGAIEHQRRAPSKILPRDFSFTEQPLIDQFNALHNRMIHVADLIAPRAEASTTIDAVFAQIRLNHCRQRAIESTVGTG